MDTNARTIEINDDEATLLAGLLEQSYRDLKQEIGSTEGAQFRDALKAREAVMLGLLEKLSGGRFPG